MADDPSGNSRAALRQLRDGPRHQYDTQPSEFDSFFFNIPRESLRFILEQHSAVAALWAIMCGLLQAIAVWIVVAAARSRLGFKGGIAVVAFFLIAIAPHLLFSWNSYAYYITQGLIVWPFLAVIAPLSAGRALLILGAALLSSGLSLAGNYALDYPALLARAQWANQQLVIIREQFPAIADQAQAAGIHVVMENRHKFLAIGLPGIAFELNLPRQAVREAQPTTPTNAAAVRLNLPDTDDAYFE